MVITMSNKNVPLRILIVEPFGGRLGHYDPYSYNVISSLPMSSNDIIFLTTNKHRYKENLREKTILYNIHGDFAYIIDPTKSHFHKMLFYMISIFDYSLFLIATFILFLLYRPKTIHFISYDAITLAIYLWVSKKTFFRRTNIVATMHDARIIEPSGCDNLLRKIQKRMTRTIIYHSDRFTVNGKYIRESLITGLELSEIKPKKLLVIPYGTTQNVDINISRDHARKILKLNFNGPIFLMFGTMSRYKGYKTVIRALGLLKSDLRVLIAGYPKEISEEEILGWANKYGAVGKIILHLRYIPEEQVKYYFTACNAILIPYIGRLFHESGPLLQACSYKIPILASNKGEIGELVERRKLGFVFDPISAIECKDAIKKFLNLSNNQLKNLEENCASLSRGRSWNNIGMQFHRIYFREELGRI